ncbi:MAG TPA: LysE family transporter [Acidimicrobiia bacterium]|nr:LysE family transporter [Acidimicrobiia bacterium]
MNAFLDGVLAGYGIAIPVGAIAVLILGTGMRCGFPCAAAAGAGAATADLVYATVAVTVGAAAARLLEPWAGPIRLASALVLIAMAVWGLAVLRRSARHSPGTVSVNRGEMMATYGRFLGLTIINPLTVIYFTSMVLGNVVGRPVGAGGAIVFAVGAFAASLSWQLLLAGVGAFGRRGLPPSARVVALVVGNLIILGLAVRMLVH